MKKQSNEGSISMDEYCTDLNLFKGLLWGTALSIPLWLSFFGWLKLFIGFLE
ncbi:hypothetical protein [Peribacillus acanthi]|uniref:hypothetical protein n=1 Tax=Peribacillus acanthi TaxID=2171554 RepID=UPI0013009B2B|nr:hypothetical protein [Peribacillus acanthi]